MKIFKVQGLPAQACQTLLVTYWRLLCLYMYVCIHIYIHLHIYVCKTCLWNKSENWGLIPMSSSHCFFLVLMWSAWFDTCNAICSPAVFCLSVPYLTLLYLPYPSVRVPLAPKGIPFLNKSIQLINRTEPFTPSAVQCKTAAFSGIIWKLLPATAWRRWTSGKCGFRALFRRRELGS